MVKAVAVDRNGMESSVNSKLFRVSQSSKTRKDIKIDDDVMFMKDCHLNDLRSLEDDVKRSAILRKSLQLTETDFVPDLESYKQKHLGYSGQYESDFMPDLESFRLKYFGSSGQNELKRSTTDMDFEKLRNLQGSAADLGFERLHNSSHKVSPTPMFAHHSSSTYQPYEGNMNNMNPEMLRHFQQVSMYPHQNLNTYRTMGSNVPEVPWDPSCAGNNARDNRPNFPGKAFQNWENVTIPIAKLTLKNSVGTQTVGLFYPTGQEKYNERRYSGKKTPEPVVPYKERKSVKNEGSPGKGYWVEGVEFIQAAIAEYVEKHAESRVLLSQMKLRGLDKFEIDKDDCLATMTLSFKVSDAKVKQDKTSSKSKEETKDKMSKEDERKSRLSKEKRKTDLKARKGGSSSSRSSSDERSSSSNSDSSASSDYKGAKTRSTRKEKKERRLSSSDISKYKLRMPPLDALLLKAVSTNEPLDTMKGYLEEGANVNACNAKGFSVLAVAVKEEFVDAIPFLVKHGAKINRYSSNGDTPLHTSVSVKYPKKEVVRALLEHRADVNKKNSRGKTVIEVATEKGVDKSIMNLLQVATERPGSASIASSKRRMSLMTSKITESSDVF